MTCSEVMHLRTNKGILDIRSEMNQTRRFEKRVRGRGGEMEGQNRMLDVETG